MMRENRRVDPIYVVTTERNGGIKKDSYKKSLDLLKSINNKIW